MIWYNIIKIWYDMILYSIVLYYIILLYFIISYRIISYYLYYIMLYYIMLYYIIVYYSISYYIIYIIIYICGTMMHHEGLNHQINCEQIMQIGLSISTPNTFKRGEQWGVRAAKNIFGWFDVVSGITGNPKFPFEAQFRRLEFAILF